MSAIPLPERCCLALVALLCALPFLQPYHLNPLTAFYSEWLAFVLGCGVALVLLLRRAWSGDCLPWLVLAPLLLALLMFMHGVFDRSPYFGQALTAALYLLWAALLVVAGAALTRLAGRDLLLDTLAAGLAFGALAGAMVGLIQHLQWPTLLDAWVARATSAAIFGNVAQANHFAACTTLGLFAFAHLQQRARIGVIVLVIAATPMLLVLGLSGSRAAALYLFAALLLAVWLRGRGANDRDRLVKICVAYVLAYVLLQVLVGSGVLQGAPREVVTAAERMIDGAASIHDRLRLWQSAWLMFLDHPLLGAGWGRFAYGFFAQAALFYPEGGYQLYHHAHNLPLQLLAETGLAGLACLLLPAWFAWRRAPAARSGDSGNIWLLAALGATIGLHSLLEYPLWYAYFLGPAALLLGAAPQAAGSLRLPALWRMASVLLLAGGLFNLGVLWREYRAFEGLFRASAPAISAAEQAALLSRLHRNPLLRHYVEVAYTLPARPRIDELDRQLYANTRALAHVPVDSLAWRQALLLALAGREQEARQALLLAAAAYPQPPRDYQEALRRFAVVQPERLRPLLEFAANSPKTTKP